MTVILLLVLITQTELTLGFYSCTPNSSLRVNGRLCYCDAGGRWSEKNCVTENRRQTCEPGAVIRHGCYECVCQNNGELACSNKDCVETTTHPRIRYNEGLTALGTKCKPFSMYFVNCSICICPANGNTNGAHCLTQASCLTERPSLSNFVGTNENNICLPKVMYVFPCLQCECSDTGYFALNKCEETCHSLHILIDNKCIPKTFFKIDCNVCWCPDDGVYNKKYCSSSTCQNVQPPTSLQLLIQEQQACQPHTFSDARCIYCDCTASGEINLSSCVKKSCIKTRDGVNYDSGKTCKPGEVVPFCIQCFCLQHGNIDHRYCSNTCKVASKIDMLQNVLKESYFNKNLINTDKIKRQGPERNCEANSIFIEDNKYCLCPDNADTLHKVCVAMKEIIDTQVKQVSIDWNITCDPNTFVKFDCNTCFCTNNSKIDPKWCTYDDCHSKRQIQQPQQNNGTTTSLEVEKCIPGSVLKINCNFCICPNSGNLYERACTKTNCSDADIVEEDIQIWCEPLTYYEVDCNVCYCPRTGIKNVDKCTKNMCEKYLRSGDCNRGDLFSDNCNVCICPLDGNKIDKVCTNRSCDRSLDHWSAVFKLSQEVVNTQPIKSPKDTKILNLCFPGEEYMDGCKTCVCPDMGLKAYSTCTPSNCIGNSTDIISDDEDVRYTRRQDSCKPSDLDDHCTILNVSHTEKGCTPGSLYITSCKQCICPIDGTTAQYCRPLPKYMKCIDSLPDVNNIPQYISRRKDDPVAESNDTMTTKAPSTQTTLSCKHPGWLTDKCYFCLCDEKTFTIIKEKCFKADFSECSKAEPTFFTNKIISAIL